MFEGMAEAMYKLHYQEEISPHLTNDQKQAIANRISELTLRAPIWLNRETNHLDHFPELQPYVKAKLTGLYLCTIMGCVVEEFRNPKDDPAHLDKLGSPEDMRR